MMERYLIAQAWAVGGAFAARVVWELWARRESFTYMLTAFPAAAFVTLGVYLFGGCIVMALAALTIFRSIWERVFGAVFVAAYFALSLQAFWPITSFFTPLPYVAFMQNCEHARSVEWLAVTLSFGLSAAAGLLLGGGPFRRPPRMRA